MKKKIKDVTFKEIDKWANQRACDGAWSFCDAVTIVGIVRKVFDYKPVFFRRKKREQMWEELKKEYLNLEAEIDLDWAYSHEHEEELEKGENNE